MRDFEREFSEKRFELISVNSVGSSLLVRYRDAQSNPHNVIIHDFRPYFYYLAEPKSPSEYTFFKPIDKLKKLVLNHPKDVSEYREMPEFKYHYEADIRYDIRFSIDVSMKFRKNLISVLPRVMFIDIEVYNEHDVGIPQWRQMKKRKFINAISLLDSYTGDVITIFNRQKLKNKKTQIANEIDLIEGYKTKVVVVDNEHELLDEFVKLINQYDPDIITGWNIKDFDIPYIIGRMLIHDEELLKGLSKFDGILRRSDIDDKIVISSKEYDISYPAGLAIMDYQRIYKAQVNPKKPSYALGFIAQEELGAKYTKLEYEGTLDKLYEQNPNEFIKYNAIDTLLVYLIERKNRFIQILNEIKNISFVGSIEYFEENYTNTMATGLYIQYARKRNYAIRSKLDREIISYSGAYVRTPKTGMHEWVVDLDASSLYPSSILSLNISPETFLIRIAEEDITFRYDVFYFITDRYEMIQNKDIIKSADKITVKTTFQDFDGEKLIHSKIYEIPLLKLKAYLRRISDKLVMSPSGDIYDYSRIGILPMMEDDLIKRRKNAKNMMLKLSIIKGLLEKKLKS